MISIYAEKPDIKDEHGCAWEFFLARTKPGQDACLKNWIVRADWAHPVWHSYLISVIHLRPIEGAQGVSLYDPRATHEVAVLALDPDKPVQNFEPPCVLSPPNYMEQFAAASDEDAIAKVEEAVREICRGRLSPDTDYWKTWRERFPFMNPGRFKTYVGGDASKSN